MKFYIIRHGETDWNNMGKIQGRIDNPLNPTGQGQAASISPFFQTIMPTHLVSSSLSRAKETLQIISENCNWTLERTIDDSFIEREFGALEACDVNAFNEVSDFTQVTNYEQDETIEARSVAGLTKYTENDNNIVVIASHSHAIRSIMINLFPEKFAWDLSSRLKNCAIVELEYTDGQYKFIGIH